MISAKIPNISCHIENFQNQCTFEILFSIPERFNSYATDWGPENKIFFGNRVQKSFLRIVVPNF